MQTIHIGNSLLGDELGISQQLISNILTCFRADVLDRAPLAAAAPQRRRHLPPIGYGGGKRCPIEAPLKGTSCRPRMGGRRCPVEVPYKKRSLEPY